MKIGIIPNLSKDVDLSITRSIYDWLTEKNVEVLINDNVAKEEYRKT